MIEQRIIDQIETVAKIEDVIGEFVSLRRQGANYVACCPFHNEKTSSFVVSPAKGIYKCFGCGEGGKGAVDFLMKYESMTFPEAIKHLGKKYNIEVVETAQTPEEKAKADKRENIRFALNFAQNRLSQNLEGSEGEQYLKSRNIQESTIKQYGIGLAVEDNQLTRMANFPNQNASHESLEAAGLVKNSNRGWYDYFRNRIMFPFHDITGNITGFTGRTITDDNVKYLNSPETELFHKGRTFYGLYQAKKAIVEKNTVMLVEGQFDVLSMVQAGIKNTICGSGTALTEEQAKLIKRFAVNVTLIYDNDKAGRSALLKNADILLAQNLNVRVVVLPEGEDPDSFCRKKSEKELAIYLENHKQDFISYKYEILAVSAIDPILLTEAQNQIADSLALIPDNTARANFITALATQYKADGDLLKNLLKERLAKKPEAPAPKKSGFSGLEEAKELLDKNNQVIELTNDVQKFVSNYGETPIVLYQGEITATQAQEIRRVSSNIEFLDDITFFKNTDTFEESETVLFLKNLYKSNFNIIVFDEYENGYFEKKKQEYGFLDFYMQRNADYSLNANEQIKTELIKRSAEIFAFADNALRSIKKKDYCKSFGITGKALDDVMKPYLEKLKTKHKFQAESIDIEGEMLNLDPNRLPEYVDMKFYNQHRFFALQTKSGRKIAYIFQNDNGGLMRVGNFFMIPLFHVYDKDPNNNKRVVQLNHMQIPFPVFVEWPSKDMINLSTFKQLIWNEDGFVFENGGPNHLNKILSAIAMDFRKCFELKVFGQQHEGFFAFANAIFHEVDGVYKIELVDEYGIVQHNDVNYYAPAYSKIYAGERKDNDKFEQDRYFMYNDIPKEQQIPFSKWASLMDEVYKQNDNGKWALLFAIMSAFRSVIYPIDRLFTTLFFIGPTESGKSQIAISIRSLFMKLEAPLFNLNSGTDAAFFSVMEKYRDVPVIFEEYNDFQISDIKFQGLKAAVYDGEGKQKKKDATSKDIDTSKVNSVPLLLGQEAPQKDDGSLHNRSIICEVPKKDDWTEYEATVFQELKNHEKIGISNILIEILKLRPAFQKSFKAIQRACFKELKEDIKTTHGSLEGQTRILNTVSLFLATCKLMEEHAQHLPLPFKYADFFTIAREKVIKQAESISSTNRLATYFSTIEFLLEQEQIKMGRELKIEETGKVKIQLNKKESIDHALERPDVKVLFLRTNVIYPLYTRIVKEREALNQQSLANYLQSHPAYIGSVKSTRFKWKTAKDSTSGFENRLQRVLVDEESNTSAIALNYEILRENLNIDFERATAMATHTTGNAEPAPIGIIPVDPNEQQFEIQGDLPF